MDASKRALIAVSTGTFLVTYDGAGVQMALPVLVQALGGNIDIGQWIITAFLVFSTAALLLAGRAGDLYGRDRLWQLGVLGFSAASLAAGLMPGLWTLIAVRAVQGLFGALLTANSAALIVESFPEEVRARALSAGPVAIALGLVLGPPAASLLTVAISWRMIFVAPVPVGLLAAYLSRTNLPAPQRRPESLDIWGGLLSTLALSGLLLGATLGQRWGWLSPRTLISFAAGVGSSIAFIVRQQRFHEPLLDLALLRRPAFAWGSAAALLGFAALFSLTVVMPFFLFMGQRHSLVHAGLIVAVVPAALSLAGPLAGWGTDKLGVRGLSAGGLISIAAGFVLLQWVKPQSGLGLVIPALGLAGAGLGTFAVPNDAEVLGSLRGEELSIGTATLSTMRNLGMTLGVATAATLLHYKLSQGQGSAASRVAAGMHLALLVGIGLAVAGAAAALLRSVRGSRERGQQD